MKLEIFLFYMCFKFVFIHGAHILSSRFQLDDDTDGSIEKDLPNCETPDELIPHMQCFLFYTCEDSEPKLTICHQPLYFNTQTGTCDEESNVPDCVDGIRTLPGAKNLPFFTNFHPFMSTSILPTESTTTSTTTTTMPTTTTTTTTTPPPPPPKSRKTSLATERTPQTTLESPTKTIRKILQGGKHKQNETTKQIEFPQTTFIPPPPPTTTTEIPITVQEMKTTSKMTTTLEPITTTRSTTETESSSTTKIIDRGCQPIRIIIHHYPGPCTAEFTCSDGSQFLIEHCTSHLLWKPKIY